MANEYLTSVGRKLQRYDGFNLFAGDPQSLWFISTYLSQPRLLAAGIHGVSNGDLDYPWPKVKKGKDALLKIIDECDTIEQESLFAVLLDREVPDDKLLPDTGVGIKLERMLAPVFVSGGDYGTRSSTVLIMDSGKRVYFSERNFDAEGKQQESVEYEFEIT